METEIDKLNKIKDKSQEIGLFLDWLGVKNIFLAKRHEHDEGCRDQEGDLYCGYNEYEAVAMNFSICELLAEYFEIDLKKVEEEKMEILNKLNKN